MGFNSGFKGLTGEKKDAMKISQKSWCNMWGVPLRLKYPLQELISISGESKFWYSVSHKICATVALWVVTTLRAAGTLFRFPVRTDILCIDSASTPFVGLTKPRIQDHLENISPRGKEAGTETCSYPLSKAEVQNTWKYFCSLLLVFTKQCSFNPLQTNERTNQPTKDLRVERKSTSLGLYRHSCVNRIAGLSNRHLEL